MPKCTHELSTSAPDDNRPAGRVSIALSALLLALSTALVGCNRSEEPAAPAPAPAPMTPPADTAPATPPAAPMTPASPMEPASPMNPASPMAPASPASR